MVATIQPPIHARVGALKYLEKLGKQLFILKLNLIELFKCIFLKLLLRMIFTNPVT